MLWLIPTILALCTLTFLLGYHLQTVNHRLRKLEKVVRLKVDKKPEPMEPKSTLIDVDDPIQTAIYEHQKELKRMNPE